MWLPRAHCYIAAFRDLLLLIVLGLFFMRLPGSTVLLESKKLGKLEMSTIGNNYHWTNIHVQVPNRKKLLELVSISKSWIQEFTDRLITYYIMPRPERRPIFRLRLAVSSESTAKQLEDFIITKIQDARSEGLEVDEPVIVREENLQRFSSIQLSFLRKLTDLLFDMVEEGFEERHYQELMNSLLQPNFCCFHLLSIGLGLSPSEEGRASLNYFLGFGPARLGWRSIFT